MNKYFNIELLAVRVFLAIVFLLPLFALPFGIFPVDFSKAMLVYIGVSVTLILFIATRISKGSILIPKSFILLSLSLVSLASLTSALFTGHMKLSLIGAGYETGTFVSFLFLTIIALLVPVMFRTINHISLLYKTVFLSALVLFAVQFLHTAFGLPLPPWDMFQNRIASVAGSWTDVGIFFGFVILLALSSIELRGEGRKVRTFLWVVLGTSLVAVVFVNSALLQYVLGFLVLALLTDRLINLSRREETHSRKIIFRDPSFFVFLVIFITAFAHNWIGVVVNFLGLQFGQIVPSWSATFEVVKATLSKNMFLGSGPNTFSYDWQLFRPDVISATPYWSIRFSSGVGRIPSLIAETGLIGLATLAVFLGALLYPVKKVLTYKEHNLERMILVSSFLSAVYLWTFVVVYSPGFLIYSFAGIFTGVFIAALGLLKETPFIEIHLGIKLKKYIFGAVVILAALYGIFVFSTKYISAVYYTTALGVATTHNDLSKANEYLQKAIMLDPQDVYFRSGAELGLSSLQQIINITANKDAASDAEKQQFHDALGYTVQNAKNAVVMNFLEPDNWMEIGKVYEAILPFDTKGFKDSVESSYGKALEVSPKDPSALLALARVELQLENSDQALKYLNEALKIKSDYSAAIIMISDIAVVKGDIKGAISVLDQAVVANPNNPDNVYLIMRIGALYYNGGDYEKARAIFEKIVEANPNYVDARYSLGLIYDKEGMTTKAIEQFKSIDLLVPGNTQVKTILSNLQSGLDVFGKSKAAPAPVVETPTKKK